MERIAEFLHTGREQVVRAPTRVGGPYLEPGLTTLEAPAKADERLHAWLLRHLPTKLDIGELERSVGSMRTFATRTSDAALREQASAAIQAVDVKLRFYSLEDRDERDAFIQSNLSAQLAKPRLSHLETDTCVWMMHWLGPRALDTMRAELVAAARSPSVHPRLRDAIRDYLRLYGVAHE